MNVAQAYLEQHRARLDLDRFGVPARLSALTLTPRFQASRHVVFLLLAEGGRQPILVAKVPRLIDANVSLAREAASLQAVQRLRPAGFDSVPQLVAFELHCGRPILIETALAGPLLAPGIVRHHPDRYCAMVLDWLFDLHQSSVRPAGEAWFTAIVERPLQQFASTFPLTTQDAALIERTLTLVEPLRTSAMPFVCEHGDLSHPNLILTSPETIGVVDWELAQIEGLIGHDLFVFLAYVAFSRHKAHDLDGYLGAFREAFFKPAAWGARMAGVYAQRAGIPRELLSPLFVLCWARYTTTLVARLVESDPASPGTVSTETAAWLRTNRYYRLWQDAIDNLSRVAWTT